MIPLGNAAGRIKYPQEVDPLLRVDASILKYITLGSYTLEPRPGNSGSTFWENGEYVPTALNALGLPNPGIEIPKGFLDLGKKLQDHGRIGRISVAGFNACDYEELALALRHLHGRLYQLELNLGCPNVRDGGVSHRPISFSPEIVNEIIRRVWKIYDTVGMTIGLKLSPYSDPGLLREIADVIVDNEPHVSTVVTCNTFPDAFAFDDEGKVAIGANDGFGGLSGNPMKHIALGQVRKFRQLLPARIEIVGVGGISCAEDIRDMENVGAAWVQVGTAFFLNEDPHVFHQMGAEYIEKYT